MWFDALFGTCGHVFHHHAFFSRLSLPTNSDISRIHHLQNRFSQDDMEEPSLVIDGPMHEQGSVLDIWNLIL